jgi:hypothetical protein
MLTYFTDPSEETITAVDQASGRHWKVVYDSSLDYWTAEHSSEDGRHIRFICAHSGDELNRKVQAVRL